MSCPISQNAVNFIVSTGNLPEGYCPGTLQELLQAFGSRLIITPSQTYSSFVAGATAPTSNQGPWLKNCEEWWFWSDTTASYIPQAKGGYNTQVYLSSTQNWTVPTNIYRLRISAWGGGGGGADVVSSNSGSGGGGGGFAQYDVAVVPGQVIPVTVGAAGVHGDPGTAGGTTTVLALTATGGGGGIKGSGTNAGGLGGSGSGGTFNLSGKTGDGGVASRGGGGGGAGGGGGVGGAYDPTNRSILDGQAPGGGGMGGTNGGASPGSGASGGCLIQY